MKAPKCPKCGKEHYSTQRCSAEGAAKRLATGPENQSNREVRGSTPPPSAKSSPVASPQGPERDAPLEGDGACSVPLTSVETIEDYRELLRIDGIIQDKNIQKQALTSAEKQQRHRDKVKADPVRYEAHLLKERERKRNV